MQERVGGEEDGIPDPEALRRAADEFAEQRKAKQDGGGGDVEKKDKKKPRKLEVRGKQGA
jgi:hypothetical protein